MIQQATSDNVNYVQKKNICSFFNISRIILILIFSILLFCK
ncbi:hypothetical protein LEP1GSC024_0890 [Leptospira noguchii str. 2001034031]|uniref:Uncharacterized protein n=1 Tax=Leptospira noguchii str. 2001034031 TaxID=1193053 RepID=M6YBT3_9LEPT|nr:hypothetical protein LEP1GSC024_0890 [Leptospira noguchii str. 2001034031]